MSKKRKIKWRENDVKLLSQRVRVFNSKRSRLIKQVPELEDILPKKANVAELKGKIYSRNDYKKIINSLNRFMKPDATKIVVTKEGVRTTKYQVNEIAINIRSINAKRASLRKQANVSTYKGTMGTIGKNNLNPKKNNYNNISKGNWEDYIESLDKQIFDSYYLNKDEQYKSNLKKGIENVFGNQPEIQKIIDKANAKELVNLYYNDPTLNLDFVYGPEEEEVRLKYFKEHLLSGLGYAV